MKPVESITLDRRKYTLHSSIPTVGAIALVRPLDEDSDPPA